MGYHWEDIEITDGNQVYALIKVLNLTDNSKQTFLYDRPDLTDALSKYLALEGQSQTVKDHLIWSISYLMNNSSVNLTTFKNQFLTPNEDSDASGSNSAPENDPNLTFVQQALPSFSSFQAAFPSNTDPLYDTPQKMFNSIGGEIAGFYNGPTTNTCAIRMSKALNYSGVVIPHITGQTFLGSDGKYYFKAAYEINKWMRKTFGTNDGDPSTPYNANHHKYTQAEAGTHGENLPSLLIGKKGIYSMYSSRFSWATGHADLLNTDATCTNGCHFDGPILRLDVWELQ